MSCSEDFLGLVPYLMGYQPAERLVLVVVQDGRVGVTISLEMDDLAMTASSRATLLSAVDRFPSPHVLMGAWSHDARAAQEALTTVAGWLGDERVVEAAWVGPERWESILHPGRGGLASDLASGPVVAQAVVAGLRVDGSRSELVSILDGPSEEHDLPTSHRAAEAQWLGCAAERSRGEALQIQARLVHDGRWDARDLTDLAVLCHDHDTVDALWLALDHRNAARALDVWLAVVAQAPMPWRGDALLMVGFSAWLAGNGVMHVAAVDRLTGLGWGEIDAVVALDALNRQAVPPSAWARVRAREVFGLPL